MMKKLFTSNLTLKGFLVIEVVVSAASLIILATGLTSAYLFFQKSYLQGGTQNRAILVAEETLEIVRNIADQDYNLLLQGTYGLEINQQGNWSFHGTSDIVGPFTRSIALGPTENGGDSDIKVAIASVSWRRQDQTTSTVQLATYLTNWQKNFSGAGCLIINTSTACLDSSSQYKKLTNVLLRNACNFEINVIGAELNWDTAAKIRNITASSTSVWDEACTFGCSPNTSSPSGTTLSFANNKFVIPAWSSVQVNEMLWNDNMNGASLISLKVLLDDGTAQINNYQLPVCGTLVDFVAPAAIVNLSVTTSSPSTTILTWTAPGDDNNTGTATTYDVRYSTSPITELNWAGATQATGETFPQITSSTENMEVVGLTADTVYYFAIKTSDEVPNISGISNVVSSNTSPPPDTTAPAAITNLAVSTTTQTAVTLTWTSPGDDNNTGTATTYDIRYSTTTITEGNWSTRNLVTGEPTPSIAGSSESKVVSGLTASTTYYFAIKTSDEVPNISAISNVASSSTQPIPDTTAPATISNLAISSTTQNSVILNWTAPGDDNNTGTATTYDIRYSTTTITDLNWTNAFQATGEPSPQTSGSSESVSVGGLTADTAYYFAIKTSDEIPNTSAISNVVSSSTLPSPDSVAPATVANLAVLSRTGTTVSLSWTAPGDDNNTGTATTYDIRYSTTTITEGNWSTRTQATGEPLPQISGTSQSSTISGLSSNTTYYFALKTSDEAPNTSALSNVVSTTTLDITAPSAISNLAVLTSTTSTITLTWTSPGDDNNIGTATTYDIRYSTTTITEGNWSTRTQATGEPTPSIAGSSESKVVSGLTASTTYYFAIKTSDEVPNISAISNVASSSTLPSPDSVAPATVANLVVLSSASSTVLLSWTSPGDDNNIGTATTYDLRYSTTTISEANWSTRTQATGEPAPQVAGSTQNMTVIGLNSDTTYFFAIKTSDEIPNTSALSNVVSTSTLDITAPAAVSNLAVSTTTQTTATLTWTSPGDDNNIGTATTYDIRYSTTTITEGNWSTRTQATGEPAPLIAGSSQSSSVTGLNPNTTYYFAIKTSDEVPNISIVSNIVSTSTLPSSDTTAPAAVANLTVLSRTGTAVSLSWTAPGDDNNTGTATTYDIRYSTTTITELNWSTRTQATGEPTPLIAGSSQNFTATGLANQTTYYFAIKTSDEVPNTAALSNVVSTTTLDIIAPAAVANLAISTSTTSTVTLTWTSPGDDNNTGTATSYDLRYSTSTITDLNWSSASQVTGEPTPLIAGSAQNMIISGLAPNTTYYFAIKTSDEVPNISAISNVPSALTQSLTQASYLSVNTSGAAATGTGNRNVTGITLTNTATSTNSTIAQMTVSWSGSSRQIENIIINAVTVWTGSNNTGLVEDITDVAIPASTTYPLTRLRFSGSMASRTLQIIFTMLDGSTKTVSGIAL